MLHETGVVNNEVAFLNKLIHAAIDDAGIFNGTTVIDVNIVFDDFFFDNSRLPGCAQSYRRFLVVVILLHGCFLLARSAWFSRFLGRISVFCVVVGGSVLALARRSGSLFLGGLGSSSSVVFIAVVVVIVILVVGGGLGSAGGRDLLFDHGPGVAGVLSGFERGGFGDGVPVADLWVWVRVRWGV